MAALRFTWVPLAALLVVVGGLSLALVLGSLPSAQVPAAKTAWRPAADPAGPRFAAAAPGQEPARAQSHSAGETSRETGREMPPAALTDLAPAAGREPPSLAADPGPPETPDGSAPSPHGSFEQGLADFRTAAMVDGGLPVVAASQARSPASNVLPADKDPEAAAPLALVGFVVIGSFQSPARAAALAERYAHWEPGIEQSDVDGDAFHRVLVGPFNPSELDSAWQRITAAGLTDAWRLTAKPQGGAQLFARGLETLD